MFKIYQLHIFKKFFLKYIYFNIIFLALIIIMGFLEEISFFKNLDKSIFYSLALTFLSAPSTLFEILPFIFLLSTQFLFFDLINNGELAILKRNSLNNFNIIKNLFLFGILIGIFNIVIFYNVSAIMKFHYLNIKNNFSNDNKYLAMVTESGIWIKDNIDNKNLIIKSKKIDDNLLYDVIINEFNSNFELTRIIQSNKIDIESKNWVIYDPMIITNNIKEFPSNKIFITTNFDKIRINNFFSDISTMNMIDLYDSKTDLERLGYSSKEISIYLLKILMMPLNYGIIIILASILMFNVKRYNSFIFNLLLGIMISVSIYYLTFIFNALGNTGKISTQQSVFFPMLILSIISLFGVIKINVK